MYFKLAIEFNGSFWHSTKSFLYKHEKIDSYFGYHLNKTLKCNEKGYRLIHIWEDEWRNNSEEIKMKLEKILKDEENLFFDEDIITLDRSWFNNIEIPNYILKEEISPELVLRDRL